MQSKRVFFSVLTIALIGVACGIGQGLSDFNIPFVPTKTNTPLPTNTPTVTPTFPPKLESASDAFEVEVLDNESTIFTDKVVGYSLLFPVEWLVVPMDESSQAVLFDEIESVVSEDLVSLLETTRKQAGIRLMAVDYTMKYSPDDVFYTNLVVGYEETTAYVEVEMDALLEENVEAVPTLIPESNVNYQAVQTNPNGVVYGKMVISHSAETFGVMLKQMMMIVKTESGVLTITGSVPDEMYTTLESIFQRIFDSLEFSE